MSNRPQFSLILCTVDRIAEPLQFVESVLAQDYPSLELIVVDQNIDDALERELTRRCATLDLKYLRTPGQKGLSRARNAALAVAQGQIIAFPDDDCEYSPGLLDCIARTLRELPDIDGVSCGWAARGNGTNIRPHRFSFLNRYSVWTRARSFTIFLRAGLTQRVGSFDTLLGLGSDTPFCSGEETDYLLRALETGAALAWFPHTLVRHPAIDYSGRGVAARAQGYSRGLIYVFHRHSYPWFFIAMVMLWPLCRALLALHRPRRASYHWKQLLGRMEAWALLRRKRRQARANIRS